VPFIRTRRARTSLCDGGVTELLQMFDRIHCFGLPILVSDKFRYTSHASVLANVLGRLIQPQIEPKNLKAEEF